MIKIGKIVKLHNYGATTDMKITGEIAPDNSFSIQLTRGSAYVMLVNSEEVEKFIADMNAMYDAIKKEIGW